MALVIIGSDKNTSEGVVINKPYLYRVNGITALGGILFGFDTAIISGTIQPFSGYFHLNELQTGWAVGCISIGAALGALLAGKLSDKAGRRSALLLSAFLFAVTGPATGWAHQFDFFIIARVLSGVGIGIAALVCPVYIAEITPASVRGRLVALYQLAITGGFLLAYLTIFLLSDIGPDSWRWMFSAQLGPAALFFIGLFFVSESPRWLIGKGRIREAESVLARIGGPAYSENESISIQDSFSGKVRERPGDILHTKYRPIVGLGILIASFSQIGGPLTVYALEIFSEAGIGRNSALQQLIIMGAVLFLSTFIAISTIDRIGRKTLLLYGTAALSFILLVLAAAGFFQLSAYWTLGAVVLFIAGYAATVGPVTWVILSEIFPNRIRSTAMSVATLALWLAGFTSNSLFPVMRSYFGMYGTFGIYALLLSVYFLIVYLKVPETKGKSLEEIELEMTKHST